MNELLGLNLKRKWLFGLNLILSKVFKILNYKIEIGNENKEFDELYEQIEKNI